MALPDFTPEVPPRLHAFLERVFGGWRVRHIIWSISIIGVTVMAFAVGSVWQMERARSQQEFTEEVQRLTQHVRKTIRQQRDLMRQSVSWVDAISGELPSQPVLWRQIDVAWVPEQSWSAAALADLLDLSPEDAQVVMSCLQLRAASTVWGGLCSVPQPHGAQRIYLAEHIESASRAWVLSRVSDGAWTEELSHVPKHWQMSVSLVHLSDDLLIWPPKVKSGVWQATVPVFQSDEDLALRVSARERPLDGLDWVTRHAGGWVAVAISLIFTLAAMQGYLMLISARRRARGETQRIDAHLQSVRARSYYVMDTAADAIIMADSQGLITWCNRATTSIFGRTSEELSGQPVGVILPALAQLDLMAWFERQGVSGRVVGFDTEGQRAEGTAFPVALSASCTDIDGELIYIFIVRDTTDAKWAEQELTLRNHALASSSSGVVIVSMMWPNQPVIYANKGFADMTGYDVQEIMGQNLRVLHKHDTDQPELERLRQAIRQGDHCQVVLRNSRKNGSLFHSKVSVSPVRNAEGVLTHYIGIQADITDRVAAEQVLHLRTERLNAVFDLSPDGFVVLDRHGEVTIVNPAFERMTGMCAADLMGQSRDLFEAQLMSLCQSVEVEEGPDGSDSPEDVGVSAQRELLHLHTPCTRVLSRRVRHGGHHHEVVMYFRDVTHEREVDRMKSEFLAMAAHELRTPMVSIFGFTALLMNRPFSPERQKDMLTTIHRQASLLINLINELLDLARIESRRGKDFKRERQTLQPIIHQVLESLLVHNDERQVRHELPVAPIWVAVDREKLSLVLTNVLSNAYKYSPGGGEIALDVVWRAGQAGEECGIRVQDHGLGMSEDQVARVFDRFFRADTSGKIPGTGLGMTIVKEIIELHGGEVRVSSVLGKGTTVTLWLPVNTAQGPRDTSYDDAALAV